MEILGTQSGVASEVLESASIKPHEIAAIGITNQRETTVVWDKITGKPIHNEIVWQCRRTASICDDIKKSELSDYIRENIGLVIDAYFSDTKIKWILDNVEGAREKAENGDLLFGNIDSWIIWNLTRGKIHVTDYSNASRTMLFNIKELKWDDKILEAMQEDSSIELKTLKVDGGASANNFLMQFQSDILGVRVVRPKVTETTVLGAAYLAGLAVGFWKSTDEIAKNWSCGSEFEADLDEDKKEKLYSGWKKAVKCSMAWEDEDN